MIECMRKRDKLWQQNLNSSFAAGYIKKVVTGFLLFSITHLVHAQDLLHYVQPLSGTAPYTTLAAQKHSEAGSEKNENTIPAVGLPFALTQWTRQT